MADNVELNAGSGGATLATDDVSGVHYQYVKLDLGGDGASSPVSTTVPVSDGSGSLTVDNGGTFAVQAAQSGTWTVTGTGGTFPVTDSSGSLTVDAPVGTPVFVRLSDGSSAIATLPVSLASVPSHAVTNAGTFAVQVDGAALTSLQLIDDAIFTDDAAYTPATSKLLVIGAQADEDSTDSVDEGDAGALRMTLERRLRVVSALDSAAMQSGNDQVTPKFAAIAASSSGDNTLVSGVGSKKLRVLSYVLMSNGTVNAKFQSSTGGDISGLLYMVANTGASSGFSPVGHFQTVAGEDLQLNLSGAVAVGGHLTYIEVD